MAFKLSSNWRPLLSFPCWPPHHIKWILTGQCSSFRFPPLTLGNFQFELEFMLAVYKWCCVMQVLLLCFFVMSWHWNQWSILGTHTHRVSPSVAVVLRVSGPRLHLDSNLMAVIWWPPVIPPPFFLFCMYSSPLALWCQSSWLRHHSSTPVLMLWLLQPTERWAERSWHGK